MEKFQFRAAWVLFRHEHHTVGLIRDLLQVHGTAGLKTSDDVKRAWSVRSLMRTLWHFFFFTKADARYRNHTENFSRSNMMNQFDGRCSEQNSSQTFSLPACRSTPEGPMRVVHKNEAPSRSINLRRTSRIFSLSQDYWLRHHSY